MARRVSSERLIGRSAELATISKLLDGLAGPGRASPRCLLVSGEAGVGKTRLVAELTRVARSGGHGVAAGACVENGAQIMPLNPVVQLLESLESGGLASAPGAPRVLDDMAGGIGPARLFQVVKRLLVEAAAARPIVAIFEDLHWADESTRDLLGALLPKFRASQCWVSARTALTSCTPSTSCRPASAGGLARPGAR